MQLLTTRWVCVMRAYVMQTSRSLPLLSFQMVKWRVVLSEFCLFILCIVYREGPRGMKRRILDPCFLAGNTYFVQRIEYFFKIKKISFIITNAQKTTQAKLNILNNSNSLWLLTFDDVIISRKIMYVYFRKWTRQSKKFLVRNAVWMILIMISHLIIFDDVDQVSRTYQRRWLLKQWKCFKQILRRISEINFHGYYQKKNAQCQR